jgi:hypothetical protein
MEAHFVTERQSDNAIFDFDQARILALYADGHSVAEIGAEYRRGVNWVYQQMAQFPDRYDEAKARRQVLRTGRYRRIAALSQKVQIKTLEKYEALLSQEDALAAEMLEINAKAIREDWAAVKLAFAEAMAEARKNEEDPPAPPAELLAIWRQEARRQEIEEKLEQISHIHSKLKDISLVGSAAEKQADLDDGKPTARVDNQGVQIVVFGKDQNPPEGEPENG